MKKLFFLLVVAAVAIVVFFVFRHKPPFRKFEKRTHSAIATTQREVAHAVKEGTKKANELKTNVSAEVKAGVERANKVTSNVVSQVGNATTNALRQVRKTFGGSNK